MRIDAIHVEFLMPNFEHRSIYIMRQPHYLQSSALKTMYNAGNYRLNAG